MYNALNKYNNGKKDKSTYSKHISVALQIQRSLR